ATITEDGIAAWGQAHAHDIGELKGALEAITASGGRGQPVADVSNRGLTPPARRLVVPAEPIAPGDESPLFDLFREEVRAATESLAARLPELDTGPESVEPLLPAVRAIKGAARVVSAAAVAELAAVMESALLAARDRKMTLEAEG